MVRALVIVILVSLIVPFAPGRVGTELVPSPVIDVEAWLPGVSEIPFGEPINTSAEVTEYTQVSRALMLSGGSSDIALSDMDDDGQTDMVVAVYEKRMISIFYRQPDGNFLSYPSYNITTLNNPFRISPTDVYANGGHQIVSLERSLGTPGTFLVVYNLTTATSFETWPYRSTYSNAIDFTMGLFSSSFSPMDAYPDLALVCAGPNPGAGLERLYVYFGPDFKSWGYEEIIQLGAGANAVESADVDDDTLEEVLVSHNSTSMVLIFEQPLDFGSPPARILDVEGSPTNLVAGLLNDDLLVDLAVTTESPSAVRIFSNSLGVLPTEESYNATLDFSPSHVFAGDLSGDGDTDLLILSQKGNLTAGFYQKPSSLICQDPLDFKFPVGALPRAAVIGDMDGDLEPDIAIASARTNWSGSNIALYPARAPTFSNSNETAWIDGGLTPLAMATGDVDGDDVVDLVVIGEKSPLVECYLGFSGSPEIITLGYVPREVIVEDFNKDGYAEVLLFSTSSNILSVVSGASLYPGSMRQLTCGGKVMDVAIGDLDNRYGTDIVAATDEGKIDIFFNSGGSIPFGTPHEFSPTPGVGIWSIAVGDFDTDGLDDIAYTRPIRKITILYQSSTSPFSTSSRSTNLSHTDGPDFTAIWGGDITGDGKDDIVGMRPSDPSLYLFDQLQFLSSPYPYATLDLPEVPRCVSVIDATDDGPVDVVAVFNSADLIFLYRQNGSSLPVSPSMVFVAGARPVFVAIGDGTGDHRGDLLSLDAGSRTVSMWQQMNFGPVANAGGPYYAEEGSSVQFEGSAITGTSEIPYMEYYWGFGDGSETGWVRNPRPTHVYLAVGNFTVDVDVRDPVGLTSSDSTYVIVEDASPHVAFTWSPESVAEGVNVTFQDTSTSYDPIAYREWMVDGVPAGGSTTLKVEFQDGIHTITLELADSDGSVRNITELISVASSDPYLRLIGPSVVTEGVPAQFQVFVDEWHGGPVDPVVLYEWDFFYVSGSFVPDPFAPNSDTVSRTFSADSYIKVNRVAVRVTDSDGESNITTWDIWVYDTPPVASFVITDPTPVEGTAFSFLSYSTSYDGIVNWTWELEYPDNGVVRYYDTDQQMALREFDDLDNGVYTMTLTIRELDGNTSSTDLTFTVLEVPPSVTLSAVPVDSWPGYYQEFYTITFKADVQSLDNIVSYEWDFCALGGEFAPDVTTSVNRTYHEYVQIGNYTVKVKVSDSDGSSFVQSLFVEIRNEPMSGGIGAFLSIVRDPQNTSNVTFSFLPGLFWFEDLQWALLDFGDGSSVTVEGDELLSPVYHSFLAGDDYVVNGTFRDDDGYQYSTEVTFWCDPPTIKMINPLPGSVVRSGTQVVFQIEPGSTSLYSAVYAVDGGSDWGWRTLYTIDTSHWLDAKHTILVTARDNGGNVVRFLTSLIIDNTPPEALLYSSSSSIYAGGELRITVRVDDENVEAGGIMLFVEFQGDDSYSTFSVSEVSPDVFYRALSVPIREGNVSFYAEVTDLAGNSAKTPIYTVVAEYRFIYWAWPYLVLAGAVAAFGTGGYFYRESRLAVDEAFVVYNDGRLITHSTRRLKPGMDDHVLGSMFVAIQDFVRDSFKDITSFTLRRLDFGDKSIVIEKGDHVFLAAVLHGQASRKVALRMQHVVEEIEQVFGEQLEGWDGNLEKTRGVGDIVKKMYSKTPVFAWSLRRKP